jgi:DNA adenine methylase
LEGDPDYHDPKIAGWWVWGISCWIGSGFCSGDGPWWVDDKRKLVHLGTNGQGVNRKLVHLGDNGRGVNRQLVHLGDNGRGVNRKLVHLGNRRGVNRKLVHLGNRRGVNRQLVHLGNRRGRLVPWFAALAARLERVRVCSGDWSRVCGPSVTFKHGLTAVFLDPPYADTAKRAARLYREDSLDVAHAVREWAIENGKRKDMRIALCGYDGEHEMPSTWAVQEWSAGEGFGAQAEKRSGNGKRERIWYSPACLSAKQPGLFDEVSA